MNETGTLTLTEFLLARIAEDEHFGTHDRHLAKRWDAECAAKRQIVTNYERYDRSGAPEVEGARRGLHMAMRHLGEVHANHPDYREEWKP